MKILYPLSKCTKIIQIELGKSRSDIENNEPTSIADKENFNSGTGSVHISQLILQRISVAQCNMPQRAAQKMIIRTDSNEEKSMS